MHGLRRAALGVVAKVDAAHELRHAVIGFSALLRVMTEYREFARST
jgi:hypothetical protein